MTDYNQDKVNLYTQNYINLAVDTAKIMHKVSQIDLLNIIGYNTLNIELCETHNFFDLPQDEFDVGLREDKYENIDDLVEVLRNFIYKQSLSKAKVHVRYDSEVAKKTTKDNIKFLNTISDSFRFSINENKCILTVQFKKNK